MRTAIEVGLPSPCLLKRPAWHKAQIEAAYTVRRISIIIRVERKSGKADGYGNRADERNEKRSEKRKREGELESE